MKVMMQDPKDQDEAIYCSSFINEWVDKDD
jgi:hypothetical protein